MPHLSHAKVMITLTVLRSLMLYFIKTVLISPGSASYAWDYGTESTSQLFQQNDQTMK